MSEENTNTLNFAKEKLLSPSGIQDTQIDKIFDDIFEHQVDSADLYFQLVRGESWSLEESIVKDAAYRIDSGVGVRANSGEKTAYAYSDDITLSALKEAATTVRSIASQGQEKRQKIQTISQSHQLYGAHDPILGLDEQTKIGLLQKIDSIARAYDPRIKEVIATLAGVYDVVLMFNSQGQQAADVRPMVRLNVSVIAEENGRREQGFAGGGGRFEYVRLLEGNLGEEFAQEAARQAILNLSAIQAPAGTFPVVLGPGWPGVLLHEAVGHGLEGDFNRKGTSAFTGRIGERVASPHCTVVDDGTLIHRRGSLNVDDEGTPTQSTILIENGILKNYLQDNLNAGLMGMRSTGNCRREGYQSIPMPRMTNTYMLAGQHDPEEIIASVDKGIYAVGFNGGQVDITSGKFVFVTSEAYLIEKGKITQPIKGATLIGNGPDVLTKVSMVGTDLALDKGIGICGKEGQSVPVGVGQPTLLVDELTVGGTE